MEKIIKTLLKEMKEWGDTQCLWIRRLNIAKMGIIPIDM